MRKTPTQRYTSTNSPAGRNGNFSVTLDFSRGPRGTVEVVRQPERDTFTSKTLKRHTKK